MLMLEMSLEELCGWSVFASQTRIVSTLPNIPTGLSDSFFLALLSLPQHREPVAHVQQSPQQGAGGP